MTDAAMTDDLSRFCCQNPQCPDYGRRGGDNLRVAFRYGKDKQRRLLACCTCQDRFSERKGTPLFGARLPDEQIINILAHLQERSGPGRPPDPPARARGGPSIRLCGGAMPLG
jgi:hypothetical protein